MAKVKKSEQKAAVEANSPAAVAMKSPEPTKKKKKKEASDAQASPKASPKVEPAAVAAAAPEKKAKVEEKASVPGASEEQIAALTKKAVLEIKEGLKDCLELTKEGKPFIPAQWAKEFKPILGGYKNFIKSQQKEFRMVDFGQDRFVVYLNDGTPLPQLDKERTWEPALMNAWDCYCEFTPDKEKRSVETFTAILHNLLKDPTKKYHMLEGNKSKTGKQKGKLQNNKKRFRDRRANAEQGKAAATASDPPSKKTKQN